MMQPADRRGEPPQPDDNDTPRQHDQQGHRGPYAPPGHDEQGNPVPSVPHEGLLGRIGVSVVLGQSVVLAAVGVAGLVTSWGAGLTAQVPDTVLALRLNPLHSGLLLVTAIAGALSTIRRRSLRMFALAQAVVYLLLFVFGTAYSVSTNNATFLALNTPDHVLHAVLALLGFVVLMVTSARIVEPPPGSLPYPGAIERDGQEPEGPTPASPEPDDRSGGEKGGPQGPQGQERAGDRG